MSKKIKIEIKHYLTGGVLFEYEAKDNTIYKTLKKGLDNGANLRDADLRDADLYGAKNIPDNQTDYYWHIHHEVLYEWLDEPVRARINFIKENKPKDEVELRLKLLKPVLGKIPTTKAGWNALHKKECGCGWNGKTIFTKKNGLAKDVA